jgi:hypothetical protein
MDCEVARQLLAFRRPGELPPDDLAALDRHLAGCPHCTQLARRQDAFDAAVASAMKAVTPPPGLRDRLLTEALARRGALVRHRVYQTLAIAAGVLLAIGLIPGVITLLTRTTLRPDQIAAAYEQSLESPPEQAVRRYLEDEGLPPTLPLDFDYRLHRRHGPAPLAGRVVPMVRFETVRPGNQQPDFAEVYIVRRWQFNSPDVKDAQNSFVTVKVIDADRGLIYVIVHSIPLDNFLRPSVQFTGTFTSGRAGA